MNSMVDACGRWFHHGFPKSMADVFASTIEMATVVDVFYETINC
jgi:hypothetical protein